MRLGKWETVRELGRGGQGTVHLSMDTTAVSVETLLAEVRQLVQNVTAIDTPDASRKNARRLPDVIDTYPNRESGPHCGAIKILHEAARSDAHALARLRVEIEVLGGLRHPSLIPILDASPPEAWFVTPFYREGTLAANLGRFAGQPDRALAAFRPLVEGVAALHERRVVHRDIKPENIFLSTPRMVLGDFGIVWFQDEAGTRISDTYENVGSRDWMPGWAMGMRLDDVRPSFDVFSLGKVLWAMVSGRTKMRLWYFDQPDFDLVRQFPSDERMRWVNRLLAGSVREHEEQVWPNAGSFLKELDAVIATLRRGGQVVALDEPRYCRVCSYGTYRLLVRENQHAALHNLGFRPTNELLRVFECPHCGHLDVFRVTQNPPAWGEVRVRI
jgi:serine/threonine protein kinase